MSQNTARGDFSDPAREALLRELVRPTYFTLDYAAELKAIRDEIAALRADLSPSSGPLITGREALQQYQRLLAAQWKAA